MSPTLDVFVEEGQEKFGDLDIVCIQDGKLIIGEVKQTVGLFKDVDFIKMAEIAERIRPDTVLFSSLDATPTALVKRNIESLENRLNPFGIKVEWYGLPRYVFEATPL